MDDNKQRLVDIFEDLTNLGYVGVIENPETFSLAFNNDVPNYLFSAVVTWLSSHLSTILKLENGITVEAEDSLRTGSLEDPLPNPLAFLVEMSSLLKELGCPIKRLTSGNLENRFKDPINRLLAVEYMIQELRASKVVQSKNPQVQKPIEVKLSESTTAKELKQLLIALNFSKPPDNIQANQLFRELDKRICTLSQPLLPADKIGDVLQVNTLTESQWYSLERLFADFLEEYKVRREMGIRRLSLTIASFFWPERIQKQEKMMQNINTIFSNFQKNVETAPGVKISDLIAATTDMAIGESISSGDACKNTRSKISKVKIGEVPDRGGRPNEQAPPPPEIPSWQARSDQPSTRGHFSGRQDSRGGDNRGRGSIYRNQPSRGANNQTGNSYQTGSNYQGGNNPQGRGHPRQVEVVGPMQMTGMPVAGDNFAQFGNVPLQLVGGQPMMPVLINPAPNYQYPPPGWSGQPVSGFGTQGQRDNRPQRGNRVQRGGNRGRGGYYQNNQHNSGGRSRDGFGGFGPSNAYSG